MKIIDCDSKEGNRNQIARILTNCLLRSGSNYEPKSLVLKVVSYKGTTLFAHGPF